MFPFLSCFCSSARISSVYPSVFWNFFFKNLQLALVKNRGVNSETRARHAGPRASARFCWHAERLLRFLGRDEEYRIIDRNGAASRFLRRFSLEKGIFFRKGGRKGARNRGSSRCWPMSPLLGPPGTGEYSLTSPATWTHRSTWNPIIRHWKKNQWS